MTACATPIADAELYRRGSETLLGSWAAIARGARDAAVLRLPGVAAAVLPHEPERSIYNNALLERDLAPPERAAALDAMWAAYAFAGVTRFAAWAHESDHGLRAALEARGYAIDDTTRAMGMDLGADLRLPRPDMVLERADWSAYLRYLERFGLRVGLLAGVDPARSSCCSRGATARPPRPPSRSTRTATAASTTSGRSSSTRAGAGSAPR